MSCWMGYHQIGTKSEKKKKTKGCASSEASSPNMTRTAGSGLRTEAKPKGHETERTGGLSGYKRRLEPPTPVPQLRDCHGEKQGGPHCGLSQGGNRRFTRGVREKKDCQAWGHQSKEKKQWRSARAMTGCDGWLTFEGQAGHTGAAVWRLWAKCGRPEPIGAAEVAFEAL